MQVSLSIHWIVPFLALIAAIKYASAQQGSRTLKSSNDELEFPPLPPCPVQSASPQNILSPTSHALDDPPCEWCTTVAYGNAGLSDKTDSFNQQTLNTPCETSSGPTFLRTRHVQRIKAVNSKGCICGVEISEAEIERGDSVMSCKVPGCETIWVSTNPNSRHNLATQVLLLSSIVNVWTMTSFIEVGLVWAAKEAAHWWSAIVFEVHGDFHILI